MKPEKTKENPDPEPLVDESSEAFAGFIWENCYDRWCYQAECIRTNEDKEPGDEGYIDPDAKDDDGKFLEPRMETPYTTPNGGQQKFGGLTDAGRKRLRELHALIVKNRADHKEEIQNIEAEVLKIVRKANGRDAIDAKRRKKKAASLMNCGAEEEDEAPDDFHCW